MATLYITEFASSGSDVNGGRMPAAAMPPLAEQTVAIGTEAKSAAFNASTSLVRLCADAICSVSFGTNPTTTATKLRLAANAAEYFAVPVGATYKVSVISNT